MADPVTIAYRSSFTPSNLGKKQPVTVEYSVSRKDSAKGARGRINRSLESLDSSVDDYDSEWSLMDEVMQAMTSTNGLQKFSPERKTEVTTSDLDLRQSPLSDEDQDEALSVSTQQDLDWFERTGLLSQIVDATDGDHRSEQLELRTLTKSQSETVRRRLHGLQDSLSRASSRSGLTEPTVPAEETGTERKQFRSHLLRDVQNLFSRQRKTSDVIELHQENVSVKNSKSPSDSGRNSVSDVQPVSRHSIFVDRPDYCLTPNPAPEEKQKQPAAAKWYLGSQLPEDIIGTDPENGIRILKINYKVNDESFVEQEPPPPVPIWPKKPISIPESVSEIENLQLEFAFHLHPTASPRDEWPDVVIKHSPVGWCRIDDLLCEGDLKTVRQLALIELTSMFDQAHLSITRRKAKKRVKKTSPETGVFGSSLDRLVVLDNNRRGSSMLARSPNVHGGVPIVFTQMIRYLEETGAINEEGILRISGETNRIRKLKSELDSFYTINPATDDSNGYSSDDVQWFDAIFRSASVHDVACVMKQFLRDLPQPILTDELVENFAQVADISGRLNQVHALNLLMLQLPHAERNTLQVLLTFLRRIVAAERDNKMSSMNVAVVIAPNLFHPKVSKENTSPGVNGHSERREDPVKQFELVGKLTEVTRVMIEYADVLLTIPPSFLRQVRARDSEIFSKTQKPKRFGKLDPRRMKLKAQKLAPVSESSQTEASMFDRELSNEGALVIRVRLADDDVVSKDKNRKVSTAVIITPSLTAGDVVDKFSPSQESVDLSKDLHNTSMSSIESGSDKSSSSSSENLLSLGGFPSRAPSAVDAVPPVSHRTHYLVETGGNIGMRKLDHSCNMMATWRQNPKASWVIKYFDTS